MISGAPGERGFYDVVESGSTDSSCSTTGFRTPSASKVRWIQLKDICIARSLSETGTITTGRLLTRSGKALVELFRDFAERNSARIALYRGPLVLRFMIGASGSVATCGLLVDRVLHEDPRHTEWEALRADLVNRIKMLKFPSAQGETTVTKPVVFGVPLPGTV
jgi:hypothetical protein